MKKLSALAAALAVLGVLGQSAVRADEPTKIKVGILLPLTGTVCGGGGNAERGRAAGDRRHQQAGRPQHALGQGAGRRRRRRRRSQARRRRPPLSLHGVRRRQGRRRTNLGAARLCHQRHRLQGADALLPDLRDGEGSLPEGQARRFHLRRPPTARGRSATWPARRRSRRSARSASSSSPAPTAGAGTCATAPTAAAKEFGAEIVGYDEVALGTSDFTTILQKVRAAKPDVFIARAVRGRRGGAPQAGLSKWASTRR